MHRLPFPSTGHKKSTQVGDLVHGDVGIVNVNTLDGFRLYSLLKDDASEFIVVKLLKKKNEAAMHVIEFCEKIKTQTGRPVKIIRTDRRTEYGGERFITWKHNAGIIHPTNCRNTPQQNGVSERANRTMMEGVSSSLYGGKYGWWTVACPSRLMQSRSCGVNFFVPLSTSEIKCQRKIH